MVTFRRMFFLTYIEYFVRNFIRIDMLYIHKNTTNITNILLWYNI
jgi:hypothetical protein